MSIANGWIIDQVVFVVVSFLLLLFFVLQYWRLRSREPSQDPPIVRFLCKIGVITTLLQFIRCLDPFGVHGMYPSTFLSFLTNETACLLFSGFAVLNYLTLTFNYRISSVHETTPKIVKHAFIIVVALQWLVANVACLLLLFLGSETWAYGLALCWVGFITMPLSLITLDVAIHRLKSFLYQSARERAIIVNREYGSTADLRTKSTPQVIPQQSGLTQLPTIPQSDSMMGFPYKGRASISVSMDDPEHARIAASYSYLPSTVPPSTASSFSNSTTCVSPSNSFECKTQGLMRNVSSGGQPFLTNSQRRPSISNVSISISSYPSYPSSSNSSSSHSSAPGNSQKSRFKNEIQPELTVTKSKALKKLVILQVWTHLLGIFVIGLAVAYSVGMVLHAKLNHPTADSYNFWWTSVAHTENAFIAIMLWYVWRPLNCGCWHQPRKLGWNPPNPFAQQKNNPQNKQNTLSSAFPHSYSLPASSRSGGPPPTAATSPPPSFKPPLPPGPQPVITSQASTTIAATPSVPSALASP